MSGLSLLRPDYIDRDLHRRNCSAVLKPVHGVPILGPAHSRPIVRSDSISMVSDRSLQDVDDAWSVFMVMHRAEDASRFHGHHTHSKLAPCHALDLRAKLNRCQYLRRNTFGLRCRRFVAHRALLSVFQAPTFGLQPRTSCLRDLRDLLEACCCAVACLVEVGPAPRRCRQPRRCESDDHQCLGRGEPDHACLGSCHAASAIVCCPEAQRETPLPPARRLPADADVRRCARPSCRSCSIGMRCCTSRMRRPTDAPPPSGRDL
jgi:hypothetical protein